MKKLIGALVVLMLAGNAMARSLYIQEKETVTPVVAIQLGALGGNDEMKTGVMGGGLFGIEGPYLGITASIYHYSRENKVNVLSKGSISMTPIMITPYFKLPFTKRFKGRLGGGVNHVFVKHTIDDDINIALAPYKLEENIDSGFGWHVNAGADLYITDNVSITGDVIYLLFETDAEATLDYFGTRVGRSTGEIDLDTVMGFLGLKYKF